MQRHLKGCCAMPMTFDEFRAKYNVILSEQQEAAVRCTEQNTLLLAVPGSGKTTVLVTHIGYMLYACDIMPERILTMTYTNAATYDMIRRFESKFGDDLQSPSASSFGQLTAFVPRSSCSTSTSRRQNRCAFFPTRKRSPLYWAPSTGGSPIRS